MVGLGSHDGRDQAAEQLGGQRRLVRVRVRARVRVRLRLRLRLSVRLRAASGACLG